jgi:hypothetical protein
LAAGKLLEGIGIIEGFVIRPANLEEISKRIEMMSLHDPQTKYVAAEAILAIKGLLDLDLANPVYKYVYERLKRLEEEWARRVNGRLIDGIKELTNDLLDYLRKRANMKLDERLIYDVKEFLRRRFNIVVTELKSIEPVLNRVVEKYESLDTSKLIFFDEDKRDIRLALLKDLFKIGLKDTRQAKDIADELKEYIEREIVHGLRRHY